MRDFPLMETQLQAAEYYKDHPEEEGKGAEATCQERFQLIANHIRNSAVQGEEGRIYKVLSVEEEYLFMDWLNLAFADPETGFKQSLVYIDEKPHDRMEIGDRVILFDISSFFDLQGLRAMMSKIKAQGR